MLVPFVSIGLLSARSVLGPQWEYRIECSFLHLLSLTVLRVSLTFVALLAWTWSFNTVGERALALLVRYRRTSERASGEKSMQRAPDSSRVQWVRCSLCNLKVKDSYFRSASESYFETAKGQIHRCCSLGLFSWLWFSSVKFSSVQKAPREKKLEGKSAAWKNSKNISLQCLIIILMKLPDI